jgi:hypothetical protein
MPVATAVTELSVRDAKLRKGLDRGVSSVRRYGRRVGAAVKGSATAVLAVGAAASGAAALFVRKFMNQEDAVKDLEAALQANGDAVDDLLPRYKEFAAGVQRTTTMGDEAVLSLMAQIRNLGILPAQMEQATMGAIGLAKALKLDANAAARYAALAMAGEYTILQRYVPALRTAETAAEKHAIVTDMMSKGFQQAQAETERLRGRLTQLRNRVGDIAEKIGQALLPGFEGWIEVGERVTTFVEKNMKTIQRWIGDLLWLGKIIGQWFVKQLAAFAEKGILVFTFYETLIENWQKVVEWAATAAAYYFVKWGNDIKHIFYDVVPAALEYWEDATRKTFKAIGDTLKFSIEFWRMNLADFFDKLATGKLGEFIFKLPTEVEPGKFGLPVPKDVKDTIDREWQEQLGAEMEILGGDLGRILGEEVSAEAAERMERFRRFIGKLLATAAPGRAPGAPGAPAPAPAAAEKQKAKQRSRVVFEGLEQSWKRITLAASKEDPALNETKKIANAAERTARAAGISAELDRKSFKLFLEIRGLLAGEAAEPGVYGA